MDGNEVDRKQSEKLFELLTSHDIILCALATFTVFTTSIFLFLLCLLLLGIWYVWTKIPPRPDKLIQLEGIQYPKKTILLQKPRKLKLFLSVFKSEPDFITISLPFLNIILCPEELLRNGLNGKHRAQLLHEFGHCNKYDITLFLFALLCSFKFVTYPFQSYVFIPDYFKSNIPFYPVTMFLLSVLSISLVFIIIHRREYIADFNAMNSEKSRYFNFLKYQYNRSEMLVADSRWAAFLKSIFHPSWKNRYVVQQGFFIFKKHQVLLYSTFWSFCIALLVTRLALPRKLVLFGELLDHEINIFFYLFVPMLVFFLYKIGGFLRDAHTLKLKWPYRYLAFGYFIGLSSNIILMTLVEDFYKNGKIDHIALSFSFLFLFGIWMLSNHISLLLHSKFMNYNKFAGVLSVVNFYVCLSFWGFLTAFFEEKSILLESDKVLRLAIFVIIVGSLASLFLNLLSSIVAALLQYFLWGKKMHQIS